MWNQRTPLSWVLYKGVYLARVQRGEGAAAGLNNWQDQRFQLRGHAENESHLIRKDAEEGRAAKLSLPSYSICL